MNVRYAHTNIIARDWRALVRFYVDVFACQVKLPERDLAGAWLDNLAGLEGAQLRGVHLVLPGYGADGPTLEVFQYGENRENTNKEVNTEGFGHIAFAVEDVEACVERVLAAGGSLVGRVVKTRVDGVGLLHVVYSRDPEGNIVEIQKWN